MDYILLVPMAISGLTGIFLLLWSFWEHSQKPKEKEQTLLPVHTLAIIALLLSAGLVLKICLGRDMRLTWFYLMDGIAISFQTDALGKFFALTVSLIWILVGIYSTVYLKHEGNEKRFFGFFLLVYGVLIGLDFSGNLVTMYLFYELMTLASFPLVLHNGSKEAIMASLKYLFYSMCGAYMGLFGIFVLANYAGAMPFVPGGIFPEELVQKIGLILPAVFVMLIGFGCKAGMFPLHAWLPTAHPVAPSPASAVLSGIIVKSGVLAILRLIFYVVGPQNLEGTWVMEVCMILSLLTVFMGSLLAFREPVLKKRLAYSTVSQVSYILFGIFVLTPQGLTGALLHVLFHAVVKCGLFLTAGIFLFECNCTRVEELKGIGKKMPVTLWCYTFFALALVGIPPTCGFVSKFYLAQGALNSATGVFAYLGPVILLISALLTAGYLLPITMRGFFPGEDFPPQERRETKPAMLLPLLILAVLAVLLGMFPNPLTEILDGFVMPLFHM